MPFDGFDFSHFKEDDDAITPLAGSFEQFIWGLVREDASEDEGNGEEEACRAPERGGEKESVRNKEPDEKKEINSSKDTPDAGEDYPFFLTLNLNARFQPVHRHELEDALEEVLEKRRLGTITGGGTGMFPSREVSYCDIELSLRDGSERTLDDLAGILDRMSIPKGSKLIWTEGEQRRERPVGRLEGLAVYLNGTELPNEVYQSCDINYAIAQLEERMEGIGTLYSWWEGPQETALYFYGSSFQGMLDAARDFLETYPLCQKCRTVQIA